MRRLDRSWEALEALDTALSLDANHAQVRFNRGLIALYLGDLEAGWPDHETRFLRTASENAYLETSIDPWRGEPIEDRRLLLWAEQGLGDTIQFARFSRLLGDLGASVTLRVQPSLVRLLASMPGATTVQGTDAPEPSADAHAALHSIPYLLALSEADLPTGVPYLTAEAQLIANWRKRLPTGCFRVGVTWRAGPSADGDDHRSFPAEALWPLAAVPGVTLIALQKERVASELTQPDAPPVCEPGGILDAGADGFIDTAAVMAQLDVVVTCDTATAHLAGALGCPVWVALPWSPDWRWQRGRRDSPWYPTMRLYRPTAPGDWDGIMHAMARDLTFAAGQSP